MEKAETIDRAAFAVLPQAQGTPVQLTEQQSAKAEEDLAADWAKAVS